MGHAQVEDPRCCGWKEYRIVDFSEDNAILIPNIKGRKFNQRSN
jgi:hypothetical protein